MKAVAAILALCCWTPVLAQQAPPETYARMVVIAPKPDQAAEFEKGYERHLQWHHGVRDPWTWYGWTFVLGERINQFMDGTFGHAAADFDAAVQPAADAADNNANVAPHADFVSHGIYERLDAMGLGDPLPDASPFLSMTTYRVQPGREDDFVAAMTKLSNTLRKQAPAERRSWYRLQVGGQAPQYVLMRAAAGLGAAATLGTPAAPAGVVQQVTHELLRYRSNLSYRPML